MSEEFTSSRGWVNRPVPEDIDKLAAALAKAQGEIENVKKGNINPHFKSAYANLASVWDAIRDDLTKNGLSVLQLPCAAPAGQVGLRTVLLHSSGQSIEDTFFMPVKDASNPQAVGSALTYARRYALMSIVGIAPEDDDGNAAKGKPAPVATTTAGTDWAKASSDMLEKAKQTKDGAALRGMYSQVRNSQMPEPGKTSLLSELDTLIGKAK